MESTCVPKKHRFSEKQAISAMVTDMGLTPRNYDPKQLTEKLSFCVYVPSFSKSHLAAIRHHKNASCSLFLAQLL